MRWVFKIFVSALVFVIPCSAAMSHAGDKMAGGQKNLLHNSGFEDGSQHWDYINRTITNEKLKKDFTASLTDKARSGRVALMVVNRGVSAGVVQHVAVQPGTTYTVTAYTRFVRHAGESYARIVIRGKDYADRGNSAHCTTTEWQKLQLTFTTGPDDSQVAVICNVRNKGVALFDDVSLVRGAVAPERGKNLLYNSSFEFETTPGVPDGWGCYLGSSYSEKFYTNWRLIADQAYDGRKCMALENPFDKATHRFKLASALGCGVFLQPSEPVVISFYAKAAQPGARVTLAGNYTYDKKPTFVLASEWQRYSICAHARKRKKRGFGYGVTFLPEGGLILIDAVMLERGSVVSSYVRKENEQPLVTPSIDTGQKAEEGLPLELRDAPAQPHNKYAPSTILAKTVVGGKPVIDGCLDDACWQSAAMVVLDRALKQTPITQKTEVRVLQDKQYLYIAFRCFDNDMANLRSQCRKHDGALWTDDCVEIFIDSCHGHNDFYQIIANADGVTFDTHNTDRLWNPRYRLKAHRREDGWSVECALPYAIFNPVAMKKLVWGISFCRENHKAKEYTYWGGAFRDMAHAGHLLGLGAETLARYMFTQEKAYLRLDPSNPEIAELHCRIRNLGSAVPIRATVNIKDDMNNNIGQYTVQTTAQPQSPFALCFTKIRLPITAKSISAALKIHDRDTAEQIKSFGVQHLRVPARPHLYPFLSFFSREKSMEVFLDCGDFNLPANTRIRVVMKDVHNTILYDITQTVGTSKRFYAFELYKPGLASGTYAVNANVQLPGGTAFNLTTQLRKQEYRAHETKICNHQRSLWVDDKPFFPIGLTYHFDRDPDRDQWRHFLVAARKRGFNTLESTYKIDPEGLERMAEYLKLAEDLGFKVFVHVSVIPPKANEHPDLKRWNKDKQWNKDSEAAITGIKKAISLFKDAPAVIGWHLMDEVPITLLRNGQARTMVDECCKLDPHHIIYMNLLGSRLVKEAFAYLNGHFPGDILSTTGSYAVPNLPLTRVSDCCDILMKSSEPKPLYPWIQSWSGPGRCPNPQETRGLVYLVIVHGATGYKVWPGPTNAKSTWDAFAGLNQEVQSLAPIIFSPTIPFASSDSAIHCCAKEYQGTLYLITVNALNNQHAAHIDLSAFANVIAVKHFFSKQPVQYTKGQICEQYEAYGRRVYVLQR